MTDQGLKQLLAFTVRHRLQLSQILAHFKPEDLENGILAIPQILLNQDLKLLLLDKAAPYLTDYEILFNSNSIFLTGEGELKQLGPVKVHYMFTITDFTFNAFVRRMILSYKEDVKPQGSMLQNLALQAAGLGGSYLKTAVNLLRYPYLSADDNQMIIDLSQIPIVKKIPPQLQFHYESSEEGILKVPFEVV